MELSIEQALQQGVAAHNEGKLQDAERLYRVVLRSQPLHPDANHNLGVLAVLVHKTNTALPLFKTALEANPKIEQFWLSYINALVKDNQFKDAKKVIKKAKKKGFNTKKLEALLSQSKVNVDTKEPSQGQLSSLLEHYQNGRYVEAEKLATSITNEFPKHQFGWKVLGIVLKKSGRVSESLVASQRAVQLAPQDANAHYNLANTFTELGRLAEAEASFKQSIALNPDFADAHYNLANTFKELGRLEEAEASFKQSIALQADFVKAHSNLGNTLQELGRLREAQESYTQALALEPESATAAQNMVKLPVGQLDLKILDLCEKAFFGQSGSVKNQASYYFSQANLLKHKGLIDQSFDEFCKANKFRWKEVGEQFEKRNRAYTENLNRIRQWTPNVPELVEGRLTKLFLLGPSRSGKSSLEHLLNKSSQVKPLYEGISYSGLLKGFVNGKERCEKLVFQGEDELLRQGYTVATSTNPDNIFNADYLIDMLPNTYFLIIKRDLRDVAPEIFINEYAKEQFYSYDPNGISTYLGVYNKLCAVLALKVPDRCITIRFEDIINSPEDTIERIGALVFRKFEVGRLDKYVTNFTSESLFRDHFSGINKSSKI